MYNNNKVAKRIRLALMIGLATVSVSAYSFSSENIIQKDVERIEITGSAIKRTDLEGALPVTVITDVQIERSGVESVAELMQQLPAMQGFTTSSDSVGGGGGGIQTASIHDLGESYTLVLLNGRRLAPRGSGSTIDLNSIPLSAIKRVDILTDGASALYGSDAIAGVVNFILKDNVNETTITGRVTRPQESGGDGWNGSITTGFGDLGTDGFNVMLSYSHDSKEQLKSVDRDFSKTGIISFKDNGRDLYFFNGSPNAIPGNAGLSFNDGVMFNPANEVPGFEYGYNSDGTLNWVDWNPYRNENGQCATNTSAIGGWCWFDYTTTIEIQPENERDSFLANVNFTISDDIQGFVEANYSDFSMTTRIAPYPSGGVLVPVGSPLYNQYFSQNLPVGLNGSDVDTGIGRWRALPAGNRTTEWNTKSTHFVVGAEGIIANTIDFDMALTHSKNDTDQNYPKGWLIESKFVDAVASGAIDIFAPAGVVTQADVDAAEIVYSGGWSNSSTIMNSIDGKVSMPVFKLTGGDAYLAVGGDYRMYEYDYSLSQANQDSILLFLSADQPYAMSRDTFAAFAELYLPATDDLEVTIAVRYDNVGAVNDDLNGGKVNDSDNDVTYKLNTKWQATENLVVRASYGTGFKAPSMLAIGQPRAEYGVTGGNYACPFEGTGDLKESWCKSGSQQYNVFSQGNPNVKSETSEQYALGFVFAANNAFSFGLDYWAVNMKDVVTSLTEAQVFAEPTKYYDLFTFKTNTATGINELAILQASVNVGESKKSGVDWHFNHSTDVSFGSFYIDWTGTYMIESTYTRPGTTDDWITSMGRFGDNNAVTFRLISQVSFGLEQGNFYHNLTLNYKSGYEDQLQSIASCTVTQVDAFGDCADVQLTISSYSKVDYQSKYNITNNASFTFGINNVFNIQPDLSLRSGGAGHQVGYDPRYVDSYGRTFYLAGKYTY